MRTITLITLALTLSCSGKKENASESNKGGETESCESYCKNFYNWIGECGGLNTERPDDCVLDCEAKEAYGTSKGCESEMAAVKECRSTATPDCCINSWASCDSFNTYCREPLATYRTCLRPESCDELTNHICRCEDPSLAESCDLYGDIAAAGSGDPAAQQECEESLDEYKAIGCCTDPSVMGDPRCD